MFELEYECTDKSLQFHGFVVQEDPEYLNDEFPNVVPSPFLVVPSNEFLQDQLKLNYLIGL